MPNALDEINEGLFFENEVGMLRLQEPSSLHDVLFALPILDKEIIRL